MVDRSDPRPFAPPSRSGGQAGPDASGGRTAALSLPKGGGAIRDIGEKFGANPATGTGSLTVPIPTSPGRGAFGPSLALGYDSGAGNGPFGLGWSLSLPAITRRTDQGLPVYADEVESDVFQLTGFEDLVPVVRPDGTRDWLPRTVGTDTYRVDRYRPRTEGGFARIERWTHTVSRAVHWRSITHDNVTTYFGRDDDSRIADGGRVFSWLISASHDGRGNAIEYAYRREDAAGVDLGQAH